MNVVHLIGRLGQKPEVKQANSTSVCGVSLATSEKYKDKEGNVQEVTDWHNLLFWGRSADVIGQYCDKGSHLAITGKIKTRSYEAKDGSKRYVTEILVSSFEFLGSAKQSESNHSDSHQPDNYSEPESVTDGLPF